MVSFLQCSRRCYSTITQNRSLTSIPYPTNLINEIQNSLTPDEENEALSCMFGPTKYKDLTKRQQDLVDRGQEYAMSEGVLLPNTKQALEAEKIREMLQKYYDNKQQE